jgi:hypothetical protein
VVAERFLSQVVNKYGLHSVSSDSVVIVPTSLQILESTSSPSFFF